MQCFTFHAGEITPGIKTTTTLSDTGRRVIFLGSKGISSLFRLVFFDKEKDNQPEIDENGLVHIAFPLIRNYYPKQKAGKKVLKEGVILRKAYPSPTKILLRINTSTSSIRKINGRWISLGKRKPRKWVSSHGFSDGQRWCDDLIAMDDQDIVMIVPAGGGIDDRMVVRNDCGDISFISRIEYDELLANHKKDIAKLKTQKKLAEEEANRVRKSEDLDAWEAGDDNNLETQKTKESQKLEVSETKSVGGEVEGKATQVETAMHTMAGETIGA